MPDTDTDSGSLWSKIKDLVPLVASAGIGAAFGGPAGAVSALGGAGEAEFKGQELQEQRASRMNDVLLQVQQRREAVQQRQEAEQDRAQDRQLQLSIESLHQQEQARHDKESEVEHKDHEKDWQQQEEQNRVERTTLAQIAHGQTIGDDDYSALFGPNDKDMQDRFGGVKDPKLRTLVATQLIKNHAAASDASVDGAWGIIANAGFNGDVNAAKLAYGKYKPQELVRVAHAIQNKSLKSPDQIEKEFKQDNKETANLAGDLKKADTAFGKTPMGGTAGKVLRGANKQATARAQAIVQGLVGSTWSGTTPTERASALKTLTKALQANPNMSYEDMAALLRPKGAPAKANSGLGTPVGDTTKPDGQYKKGGKVYTVKDKKVYEATGG